jgi:hypothetical protein
MRLFSDLIIFLAMCLAMVSAAYGVQDAFLANDPSPGVHRHTRGERLVPFYPVGAESSPLKPAQLTGSESDGG